MTIMCVNAHTAVCGNMRLRLSAQFTPSSASKNGTCSGKDVTVCSDCHRRRRGYSPWSVYLENTYVVYKGEQLAAVLIQLAWQRYKGEFESEETESEEEFEG